MNIVETFDPLLDCGDLENGSFELRGHADSPETALVYAYCKIDGVWREARTQKGNLSAEVVAAGLLSVLKREAA